MGNIILGIDPGSEQSGYCLMDSEDYFIRCADKVSNVNLLPLIASIRPSDTIAIESIQSYGQAVGRAIFDTCFWIGRFIQRAYDSSVPHVLYPRPEIARSICGVGKTNDSILRQSLLLRFGGDKKGEPLHMLKGSTDKRSAFAVAVYHADLSRHGRTSIGK